MKKIIMCISALFFLVGCAPKMDKLYTIEENKSNKSAEISIIRNYNFGGSAIRLYPTVNNRKIAGLYTKNYIRFYLREGKYVFGLSYPNVVFGKWVKEQAIKKYVRANNQYYFLLSPSLFGMEIEEIDKPEGEKRIFSSTFIKTGKLSNEPDAVVKLIRPISDILSLKEDTKNRIDITK